MDSTATTKRSVLKSIASYFDLFGFTAPVLNRARVFLHSLQYDRNIGWDNRLSGELIYEWNNIVKQANATPEIMIQRFVVEREDSYRLLAFTDSSKSIYGVTLYIQSESNGNVSFFDGQEPFYQQTIAD